MISPQLSDTTPNPTPQVSGLNKNFSPSHKDGLVRRHFPSFALQGVDGNIYHPSGRFQGGSCVAGRGVQHDGILRLRKSGGH